MHPDALPRSPREDASLISKILFWWIFKLFRLGWKRELELSDLYRVPHYDRSATLGDKLSQAWDKELEKAAKSVKNGDKKKYKASLGKALWSVFGWSYSILGIFAFTEECFLKIIQPIFLGLLIRYFGGEFQLELNGYMGYVFAGGLVTGSFFYTVMHHPFFFETQHCGMTIRVACSSLIYRKALKLSQSALGKTTIGQLVNLLSNDVNRFDIGMGMIHYVWIGPLQLGIVIYILWGHFGWPCLLGAALLVLFVPFQSQMGRLFGNLRIQVAIRTDKRVRIMNEIISGMRVIKMYTWERPFANLVAECREDEVKYIKKTSILRAINLSLYYISSKVIIFLTLLTYVMTGNYLTSEKVFVTLSLYNSVRLVMTLFFPNAISQLAEIFVSINRLQNFLMMEDRVLIPQPETTITPQSVLTPSNSREKLSKSTSEPFVKLENLTAKWDATSEDLTLENISLEVTRGKLLAIIGPVGCGKGSLLQVILRELPTTSGKVITSGKIAYTSQEPWIFGGSVRENILFGLPFDPEKYDEVIKTCALERDLTLLPYGDNSVVGDRGSSLSGGQKARVNLARAVYSDADIFLLDDPLSAVDAEVGKHLFNNCIIDSLRNRGKAVILVTHQLQFLKAADELLLLKEGRMEAQGNYTHLLKSGINFTQLLKSEDTAQDHDASNALKYKGTGLSTLTRSNSQPQFRRSASMSMLELGVMGNELVPEEFEWEEEPAILRSYARSRYNSSSRRMSKPLVPSQLLTIKRKKTSSNSSEETPLLAPQANRDELRSTGDISFGLYWRYIRAGSSLCALTVLFFSNILVQVLFSGSDYFLQLWTENEESRFHPDEINNNASNVGNFTAEDFSKMDAQRNMEIYIYSGIISLLFVVSLVRTAGFLRMCLTSSINLHKMLFNGVLRAPMRFFEINPVGRILNRFAKDCGIIDESLPPTLFDTMDIFLQFTGVIVIVCSVNPILLAPSALLGIIFYFVRRFYLETARSVKRLEGVARSPIFSHLSTSLYGLTTIRAFGVEDQFERQFDAHQDLHSSSWYLFLATARWLGIFVDWCSVAYIAAVTFSFLLIKQEGAAAGLAISSAMTLTGMFQWGVRQSAETENNMVSVERLLDYSSLEPEAELESSPANRPPKSWPLKGQIVLNKVMLRYGDDAPVLHEITCTFKSKEKVGVVGRTGAGKSSLITALFRIAEPCSGSIEIDGVDVLKIGLHDLRSKISIIPQDPVLFIGTLRKNLDPFNNFDDDQLWQVLEEVHLAQAVRDMPAGLDTQISEGGSNFSVGQRQLICLGRAIVRKNKILVLDEATSNIDGQTDAFIQTMVKEKFSECTVITVAHRLNTVIDCDRILVLDAGRIKEFDEPYKLLLNTQSSLHQLIQQTGKANAANLINLAKKVHDAKQRVNMGSVTELGENSASSSSSSGGSNESFVGNPVF